MRSGAPVATAHGVRRRASARTITAVVPYYGYARADRKVHGRESIAAKLTANLLTEAGITRMLSVDLHSGQCVGYFDIPVDHVYGEGVLLDYLASKRIPDGACAATPTADCVLGARARQRLPCSRSCAKFLHCAVPCYRWRGTSPRSSCTKRYVA
jgi:phosphoribosylpyrophosphate synthetase